MAITRRTALRALATAGTAAMLPRRARARTRNHPSSDAVALLYDPTRCIGCKRCIVGCAEENGGDADLATADSAELSPRSLTVLRSYGTGRDETYRKAQCMHCVDPACVSACMLGAMRKGDDGAVTWNADLCVGCRYCEIACPFNIPRFEWDTPLPRLTKCQLCPERRARGLAPACVERCHRGALAYGRREDLLSEAHYRIQAHPERYNPRVYGEDDGGGTSVLYLAKAGVSFVAMGLPELGTESVPSLPETIQHTLYKGFLAPLALLGLFGAAVRRSTRALREAEGAEHGHEASEAVGGRILTWPFALLAALALVGLAAVLWRFTAGLGAATNLNDGYPMGLWIAFDVVTGTALACGGYAMALLVYVLNRGRYHPLVRAALVTSALGYTLGGLSVLIDIGRPWNFYKIPLFFWDWNLNSILLEVALCIMLYTAVLWIEVSPAVLERWRESQVEGLRRFAVAASPKLERALPWFIALGLLLPTMHQSSLGSLMLMAGQKLHPLWHTPLLPLLFLVSCVAMGYAAVTLEATISARVFRRPSETPMLRALAGPVSVVLLLFATLRVLDLAARGRLDLVAVPDFHGVLFLVETGLFVLPALALLAWRRRAGAGFLAGVGVAVVLAGALFRFSTYLLAFDPGPAWSYVPSLAEFAVSVGLVAAEIMGYVVLVKRFPILRGVAVEAAPAEPDRRRRPEAPTVPTAPTAVGVGMAILLSLLASASGAPAQETRPPGDLRCLTDQEERCLSEPVPADEPHGALCATCHDLGRQKTLAEAAGTCATAACHGGPASLTPFHRTLHAGVIDNCIGCHRPHDARIPGGGENCLYCHGKGGETFLPRTGAEQGAPASGRLLAAPAPATPTPQGPGRRSSTGLKVAGAPRDVTFDHLTHTGYDCTACHDAEERHTVFRVTELSDCRSCHHTPPVSGDCLACHTGGGNDPSARRLMVRTLDLRVGSLDRPLRVLPFEHRTHQTVSCGTCHTEGAGLGATGTDCTACHEEHHRPTATCVTCHPTPAPGAHDATAHLGCGVAGCHTNAAATVIATPRTRSVCLVCHRDEMDHRPGQECIDCHILPPPRLPPSPDRRPTTEPTLGGRRLPG